MSGEVDGASAVELEVDSGLAGHDQRADDHFDVAAGEEMGVELIDAYVEAGFDRVDAAVHDQSDRNLAQPKREQLGVTDPGAGHQRANPNLEERPDHQNDDQPDDKQEAQKGEIHGLRKVC